jgi:putative aldouronate transport system substrate-binding protein
MEIRRGNVAKKIFALLLVVFLLTSAFGCTPAPATSAPGQATTAPGAATNAPAAAAATNTPPPAPVEEIVVLDYYWVGNADTDQRPLVEAAINNYVGPLIGVNVVFHIVGWGDWASKAVTGLQAGEKMDIFFTADWWHYMQLASEGLFRPLNDDAGEYGNLLKEHGQGIVNTLNPAFITGTQIDGVNYAVPTNKELTVPEGFVYNVTWAEEIGLTPEEAANIKSFEDMEPWLEKAKAAYPSEYPYMTDGRPGFQPWVPDFAAGVPGNIISMKFEPDSNGVFDETIVSTMETDWAMQHSAKLHEWYLKGWIHPDAGLTTFDTATVMNAGKFLFTPQPLKGSNIKAQELINSSGNADLKLGEIYTQSKINITVHSGGSMLAIPMLSDHPVEAMKFINLMHTDSKLLNMMLFGVEGTHWDFEADGRVNLKNSAWYGAHPGAWTLGNTTLQAVSNKEDPKKNQMLIDYSDDSINHASLGFRFRTEPVAAELTALNAVVDGMNRALMTGYVDPAVELPKYIDALKAAGLDTVKAEVEKQYTAWKAAKGQ